MDNKVMMIVPITNLSILEELKEVLLDERVLVKFVTQEAFDLLMENKEQEGP